MKYNKFLTIIRKNKLYVFSFNDIVKLFSDSSIKTIQNQLQLWTKKGLLIRLKKGLYKIQFPEGGPVLSDLYIANKMYEPSYVSLETALSFYSIIPEVAAQVTSVTTRQTKLFRNKYGVFMYSSCKNEAFSGYKIIKYENNKVLIAEKEKALVDFIYFKNINREPFEIKEERFDEINLRRLSWQKVFKYAGAYNKKTLLIAKGIKESLNK